MLNTLKKLSIIGALCVSYSANASTTIADFGGVTDTGGSFNQFTVDSNGIEIKVSGWSDTGNVSGAAGTDLDPTIERAVDFDKNTETYSNGSVKSRGWSMENKDEGNSQNCGYSHSADNFGSGCDYQDYDFFLLEFSEAVTLHGAGFNWLSASAANTQVSVAALSSGSLNGKTWQSVKDNQTIASDYSQMRSTSLDQYPYLAAFGSHFGNNFGGGYAANNVNQVYANFWLIGALNSVFGGETSWEGNDGMKLSAVKYSKDAVTPPPLTVPEPSSIALFGLAIIALFSSNRKKIK